MFPTRRIVTSGGDVFRDEYSLAFDGTNDYVDCGSDSTLDFGTGDFAISSWFMIGGYTADGRLLSKFANPGDGNTGYIINASTTNNKARFKLYDGGKTDLDIFSDSALSLNTWHHMVCTRDSATMKMYINGSLQTDTEDATGYDLDNTDGLALVGANFDGNISDVAIYNSALSSSQVKTIYNGREPYNHKEGVAVSNLVAWWRMGDGALDDRNGLIADQTNATLGSEVLGDPEFNTDVAVNTAGTYWTTGTVADCGWTIANGVANQDGSTDSGGDNFLKTSSNVLSANKIYKIVIDISSGESGGLLDLNDINATIASNLEAGTTTFYHTADGSDRPLGIDVDASTVLTVNNISVKEVNGNAGVMTNMEAGDFTGDTP